MVMLTSCVGFALAGAGVASSNGARLFFAVLGTGLVASGASALNMVLERRGDEAMERTRLRALPSGRLRPREAIVFGLGLSFAGWTVLATAATLTAVALAALTWALYLFVYTPLKTRTPWATYVGAIPGALPPLIGWAASGREMTVLAWVPFGILFCWQIPHFLAIAWVYRDDYALGHLRVLPVVDPVGARTARHAFFFALALLAVSLAPAALGLAGVAYAVVVALLGASLCTFAAMFAWRRSRRSAHALFLASLPYLALVQIALVLAAAGLA
jgi:protoheme IX farnesyltransferase